MQRSKIESGSASGVTLKDDAELGHRLLADEAAEAEEVMAERTASSNGWFSACGKPTRGKGRRPGPPGHDDLCAVIAEGVPDPALVRPEAPNELWLTDSTEHTTSEGQLYLCAIKDVFSGRIVG